MGGPWALAPLNKGLCLIFSLVISPCHHPRVDALSPPCHLNLGFPRNPQIINLDPRYSQVCDRGLHRYPAVSGQEKSPIVSTIFRANRVAFYRRTGHANSFLLDIWGFPFNLPTRYILIQEQIGHRPCPFPRTRSITPPKRLSLMMKPLPIPACEFRHQLDLLHLIKKLPHLEQRRTHHIQKIGALWSPCEPGDEAFGVHGQGYKYLCYQVIIQAVRTQQPPGRQEGIYVQTSEGVLLVLLLHLLEQGLSGLVLAEEDIVVDVEVYAEKDLVLYFLAEEVQVGEESGEFVLLYIEFVRIFFDALVSGA